MRLLCTTYDLRNARALRGKNEQREDAVRTLTRFLITPNHGSRTSIPPPLLRKIPMPLAR